jgi:phage terminase small subunit
MKVLQFKAKRFVEEYLAGASATQAALRAGYSPRNAPNQANMLMKKPEVQAAIAEGQQRLSEDTKVRATDVFRELQAVSFSDLGDILNFDGDDIRLRPASTISSRARRAISSVKVRRVVEGRGEAAQTVEIIEFKLWDKLSALDKLAKHLGLLKERVEIMAPDRRHWSDNLTHEDLARLSPATLVQIHRETLNLPALPDSADDAPSLEQLRALPRDELLDLYKKEVGLVDPITEAEPANSRGSAATGGRAEC